MSGKQMKTWQKATALVPLALLSAAWTASLAMTGTPTAAAAGGPGTLPDGTSLPSQAIKAPASVSVPGEIAPGVPAGSARSVVSGASTNGIPAAALSAYQRAAQVIDAADPSCHLSWPLIAAIGRVESDHGRYAGNTLGDDGVSKPGIYGIPLDGSNGTAKVLDTDGGQYDNDPVTDRAVGPMQFIPSTWTVVGVDADGDGRRNPQDIDDAALATAVYLCSGQENLSTAAGQQSAVYRYNHSQDYVNLVLSIMRAYTDGDFSSVPNGAAAPTVFTASDPGAVPASRASGTKHRPAKARSTGQAGSVGSSSGSSGGGSGGGSGGAASGGGTGSEGGSAPDVPGPGGSDPVPETVEKATAPVKKVTEAVKPVVDTLTNAEATALCGSELSGALGSLPPLITDSQVINGCADKVHGKTRSEALGLIAANKDNLLGWLGL